MNMPTILGWCSLANNTGMQLNEFKDLLRKVLNTPGQLEALATGGIIPTGGIILWSGSTVPTGWYLCDGTNGTPDLADKFVLAAAVIGDVGTTATEQATVIGNHTVTIGNHVDDIVSSNQSATDTVTDDGTNQKTVAIAHTHTTSLNLAHSGSTDAHDVTTDYFPPYYTLAYIMKS